MSTADSIYIDSSLQTKKRIDYRQPKRTLPFACVSANWYSPLCDVAVRCSSGHVGEPTAISGLLLRVWPPIGQTDRPIDRLNAHLLLTTSIVRHRY
jgi:hypothetical protein